MRPRSALQTPCRALPMKPAPCPDAAEIALVTHEYFPFRGGAATLVREVAAAVSNLGASAEVWAPDYGRMPDPADQDAAFCTFRWPNAGTLAPWNVWRLAVSVARASARRRPWRLALLSIGAIRAALWVRLLLPGALPGRVTVVHHGSEILKLRQRPFWSGQMRQAFAEGWRPACTTEAVADLLRASGWLEPGAAVVRLPCALPGRLRERAEAVSPPERDGPDLRLLTLARWHPRKGQKDVAEALARLPVERRARLTWVVGGTGDAVYQSETLAIARAAGVAVENLGEVAESDLPAVYAGCDAYVMASRSLPDSIEGFGLTYLEAGAFGLPVIGTRTGGVAEAIEDGVTGLLVPEADLEALSTALSRLLGDAELRRRLGQAGRARALATSWREAAENLLGGPILC